MKKLFAVVSLSLVSLIISTACGFSALNDGEFGEGMQVAVVTREEGSGTRGAFIELLGIQVSQDGTVTDMTSINADIANGTNMVISSIINNRFAIGYITLGSLNDTVKAVNIDGVTPSIENILNGSYPVFRPFYIAYSNEINELRDNFISFILSSQGQDIVRAGYVPVSELAPEFVFSDVSGSLTIVGSTAVAPVMQLLAEAYEALNQNVNIEIQIQGSSAGITSAITGTAAIGMSSRSLTADESAQINYVAIAYDGLVVIVNNNNPIQNLTQEQVRQIFVGEITHWDDVID